MKNFKRLRNLVVFPLIAVLLLLSLAIVLNKAPREAASALAPKTLAPGEDPDARAEAARAEAQRIADAERAMREAADAERTRLTGIWAPLPGGCEQGYGIAFAADGRFSDGDEEDWVEGEWNIEGGTLVRRHRIAASFPDGDLGAQPLRTPTNAIDRLTIERLSRAGLTLSQGRKSQRYIKCRTASHTFLDGSVFEG